MMIQRSIEILVTHPYNEHDLPHRLEKTIPQRTYLQFYHHCRCRRCCPWWRKRDRHADDFGIADIRRCYRLSVVVHSTIRSRTRSKIQAIIFAIPIRADAITEF